MQIWDRLRYGLSENGGRTAFCPSGLHPDGMCSCDSFSVSESSTHSSISRIVMLAEALFEVLCQISFPLFHFYVLYSVLDLQQNYFCFCFSLIFCTSCLEFYSLFRGENVV